MSMSSQTTEAIDPSRFQQWGEGILPDAPARGAGTDRFVALAKQAFASAESPSANSAISAGGCEQRAVYPEDSVIADWMEYGRATEESADAFLIGSIMPVCGALLGRRVSMDWGSRRQYPNIFAMLAGKAGDRKSSAIMAAAKLAREVLPDNAFLPGNFSPETLFDEYAFEAGGRPDKLWVVDDANAVLTDWRKSGNGERNATRFLGLYDCQGMTESFRRNREGEEGSPRRVIPETTTSIAFGATFNVAAFQDQATRTGMARRFLYYVAGRHGRLIVRPGASAAQAWENLVEGFGRLGGLNGPLDFSPDAADLWAGYQRANRRALEGLDATMEAAASRLSSAPMQALHVAMIFEGARYARTGAGWSGLIRPDTLKSAIEHVDGCLVAADRMESLAQGSKIAADADVLLSKIRRSSEAQEGFHIQTRSNLTAWFCHDSGRRGAWTPDYLYHRLIPHLQARNEARRIRDRGQGGPEVYAFRSE